MDVVSKPSMAALLLRRGQSAQANIAGLSGCKHCVFLPHALVATSSPTKAATAIGCVSKPSSMAALLLRRGQSAQANIAGLSGCKHCVFRPQAAIEVLEVVAHFFAILALDQKCLNQCFCGSMRCAAPTCRFLHYHDYSHAS